MLLKLHTKHQLGTIIIPFKEQEIDAHRSEVTCLKMKVTQKIMSELGFEPGLYAFNLHRQYLEFTSEEDIRIVPVCVRTCMCVGREWSRQGLASFFSVGSHSEYFRLCGSHYGDLPKCSSPPQTHQFPQDRSKSFP